MKFNLQIMKQNYKTYEKACEEYEPIKDYLKKKIKVRDLNKYGLRPIGDFISTFNKIIANDKERKILTGETIIDFDTLIKQLEADCERYLKYINRNHSDISSYDITEARIVIRRIQSLLEYSKEDFDKIFNNKNKFDILATYTSSFEGVNIYKKSFLYINNYLIHNDIEISSDVFHNIMSDNLSYAKCEYYTKALVLPPDFDSVKVDNTDKLLDTIFESFDKSGSIIWDYLVEEINERIIRNQNVITEKHKMNDKIIKRNESIDELTK